MRQEVFIDMSNQNALYSVSMLSAMLENGTGNYLDLLTPFVLYSLPREVGAHISISEVVETMSNEFGFVDFPHKTTESILNRLSKKNSSGVVYIACTIIQKKKSYSVAKIYDNSSFDSKRHDMRKKIDGILKAIQDYFLTHYYYKIVPLEDIKEQLINFFEGNGLSVIRSVDSLKLIQQKHCNGTFEIARFVINEYEKQSLVYEDLCEVTKGFLTYKAIYYFCQERKDSIDSKFQNVTFYLDCSLVLDALGYDTPEDEKAVKELIRLIRRNGGNVQAFDHTVEEAMHLIEAFANKPQYKNSFRLEGLESKNLPSNAILALARTLPSVLKEHAKVETVDTPSLSDHTIYKYVLGEQEIIDWLKSNRQKSRYATYSDDERYQYDAKSLIAIGILRRNQHPHHIEHAKAILITQDNWLNRCIHELYSNELRNELNYCISDTELVSLLWLREYKRVTTLPSDVLIANAHAACRVSNEVMERAIQIAHSMKETGTLTIDAALLVSAHSEFASFLAEQVRNDPAELNESSVKSLISGFIEKQSEQKVITARNEEKALAEKKLSSQKVLHESISAKNQERFQSYENQIAALQKEKQDTSTLQRKRIVELADKQAKRVSTLVYVALYCILFFALGTLCTIFTIHSITEYCAGNVWLPYLVVDFLSFLGILQLFLPRKSFVVHLICRVRDRVYAAVYSRQVQKYEDLIM